MLKEKYITPETEEVKISAVDVITTSVIETFGDELVGIDKGYMTEDDPLFDLF